ncbi:NACHT domain-containing protein [Streptomyces kanamyceticus]|uniref:NACHT domain-containing protein n=1 Tax=Streptomyces kanamyceticus TaxID=1967 RepID=UPI001CC4DFFF|nr:NACHT domain-containing protein [Streptomyces kanamyceticus]
MSAEAAALRLGSTIATRAVRLWLAPKERAQQAGSPMGELIRLRVPGLRAQRSVERQFQQIADAVAARVQPLLEHEFRGLTENGREAVLAAVTDTFVRADLSDETVLGSDLVPAELARRIRASAPVPSGFSEVETRFYEVIVGECCDCYVRVLRRLPVFTERAVTELLARATTFGDELEKVLERLPARSLYAPEGTGQDEAFRREYLGLVSRSLDEIELFGLGPSERAPRTKLSVAYVSLRATGDDRGHTPDAVRAMPRAGAGQWQEHDSERAASMRVEAALKDSPRVLLRGEAGSGKTTLLQWLAVTAARGTFTGPLAEWNGLIPVLIKLRQYAASALPSPEEMLDRSAAPVAGLMPAGWMHRAFADGRVLLLVDGVDELLADPRRGIRDWLRTLLNSYGKTRVIVTSRPAEERLDWLRAEEFGTLHLERMTPADLTSFIRRWHQAVSGHEADLPCLSEDLPRYERSLLTSIKDRPHLQSLATNPLLAALLCAMHLARRGQLPRNRMELYRMALEVLVQQRDADRGGAQRAVGAPDAHRQALRPA